MGIRTGDEVSVLKYATVRSAKSGVNKCIKVEFQLLPGVKVVIANPETRGQCADSHLGEIWVGA